MSGVSYAFAFFIGAFLESVMYGEYLVPLLLANSRANAEFDG